MSGTPVMPHWLRERLKREAARVKRESNIVALLGDDVRVLVRFDIGLRKFVFSFRTYDDLSSDGVESGWIELR